MAIKEMLWEYRFVIALALVAILYAIAEWKNAKALLYSAMLLAKDMAKDKILKGGSAQEEWVVQKAYEYLPKRLTLFIPKDVMRKIIHWLYVKAKDKLDDGQVNNSIT